ncbi:MAG: mercury methylation corrinoid protein HgcA [Thermoleophilia bacterium]
MAVETIPQVATHLTAADILGRWRVRLGVRRSDYRVAPGLYAVGAPGLESPVLVTANYKLSFDALRSNLPGMDAWLLVLDTKGVNVWCAAGRGTFGTDELVRRIEAVGLMHVVSHRTVVVPQLGAPGVAAHEVRGRSGFRVAYGPVRAVDIPAFLHSGLRATPEMRRVSFTVKERLAVTGVEIVRALRVVVPLAVAAVLVAALLTGVGVVGASWGWLAVAAPFAAALVAGLVAVPALLPWIPGRAFASKGAVVGAVAAGLALLVVRGRLSPVVMLAALVGATALTSYLAVSFTGSTTFTSPSGVEKEMRRAIPVQLAAVLLAAALFLAHVVGAV